MAEYHVGCSPITGTIYAGTVNKNGNAWLNKSDVTEEALSSVRDHLENQATLKKKSSYGYEWTKKDGTKVQLFCKIVPPKLEEGKCFNPLIAVKISKPEFNEESRE